MDFYNTNKDNYDALGASNYGIEYEYSNGKTMIFRPQTEEQRKLKQDSRDANLSSYYNSVVYLFLLIILLGLILISYLICYFTFKNMYSANNVFSYIILLWVILLFLHICYSLYLHKYAVNLRDKVEKEIPNETKYK